MLAKQFAIVKKGIISAVVTAYPPHKLKRNQIPLTWDEYLLLCQLSSKDANSKGIDLSKIKKMIREIERKMK